MVAGERAAAAERRWIAALVGDRRLAAHQGRAHFAQRSTSGRDFCRRAPPRRRSAATASIESRRWEQLLARLEQVPGLVAALHSVRALPPPRYDEASWSFVAALLDVLRHAVARLQLVFAQENAIDYPESTLIALRALSSDEGPSELLLALDMRIEHLLVDEFQDTSLAQHQLIERLTDGWTPGDGRTLFVVGDPMQSIYRFREADVGLFLAAQRDRRIGGVALEPLTLTRNFRSRQGLVDWVNATFSSVFPSRDDPARGAVAFKPSAPTREADADAAVTIDLCADDLQEAAAVVSRIRGALAGSAETIAVLVRKRSDLDRHFAGAARRGIAFSAVELDQLSERQTVLDLCSLTHALMQPDDRLAWLATLRAPWCGLTLPDLFAVARSCGKRALSEALSARPGSRRPEPAFARRQGTDSPVSRTVVTRAAATSVAACRSPPRYAARGSRSAGRRASSIRSISTRPIDFSRCSPSTRSGATFRIGRCSWTRSVRCGRKAMPTRRRACRS